LVAFAAIVIVVNVRKIDADLKDLLDDAARLSQVSLAVPCGIWTQTRSAALPRLCCSGAAGLRRDPL
jgi:hypothetical protein